MHEEQYLLITDVTFGHFEKKMFLFLPIVDVNLLFSFPPFVNIWWNSSHVSSDKITSLAKIHVFVFCIWAKKYKFVNIW